MASSSGGRASGTGPRAAPRQDVLLAPPTPPQARAVFGASLGVAERYAELLAGPGVERGLLGPREVARLWDRHLLNCAAVAELVPHPGTLVDIGSGAGLPGIVLAMLLPDVRVVLLEPMARRASFLAECTALLGLGNTAVWRSRAQEAAGRLDADVATARAVAPMDQLAGLALRLVRPGGLVLAIKGAGAADEIERARHALRRAGARDVEVVRAGGDRVSPPAVVVRMIAGRGGAGRGGAGRGGALPDGSDTPGGGTVAGRGSQEIGRARVAPGGRE